MASRSGTGGDLIHRDGGPAIEYPNGTKRWYRDGVLHREDGPAIEWYDGSSEWFLEGKRHREDGSAKEYPNGDKKWYLNGKKLSKTDFTSIEMINKMQAWELFTPKELARMGLDKSG